MDPIIRAAPVASTARMLGRAPVRPVEPVAPPAAPEPVKASVTPAAPPLMFPTVGFGVRPPPASEDAAPVDALLVERDAQIAALRETAHKAQVALLSAHEDAERRGFSSGEEKGERIGRELLQVQADRLKSLVYQIGQSREQVMAAAEDTLIEIAFAAVCRIIGEQGATRETVQRMVREASAVAHERDQLTVRLHPDDLALLRIGANGPETDIRLAADPGVALGGCIVDSGTGSLDARFETQLELLGAALSAVRAERHTGQADV